MADNLHLIMSTHFVTAQAVFDLFFIQISRRNANPIGYKGFHLFIVGKLLTL